MANILLIDEKPGVRRVLAEELASEGHTVLTTGNFSLVNEIVRFSNLDMVVMDPYVKEQHRWDVLLDIKQEDCHLPVLIVTDFPSYRRDPRSTLAAGLLVRGFDFADLLQKIAEVLQQKQAYPYSVESERKSISVPAPYPLRQQAGTGSREARAGFMERQP